MSQRAWKSHKFADGLPSIWLVNQAELRAESSENFLPLMKCNALSLPHKEQASPPWFSAPSLTPPQKTGFSPTEHKSSNCGSVFERLWKLSSSASGLRPTSPERKSKVIGGGKFVTRVTITNLTNFKMRLEKFTCDSRHDVHSRSTFLCEITRFLVTL